MASKSYGGDGPPLAKFRKQYENYLTLKLAERAEAREARLYYHGSQWTETQLKELKARGQPPTTTPQLARKINGFVGLIEKLRQDPKAYPRTGNEDQGAELCTAALRYALDQQEWEGISPFVSLNSAVDAIGGIELSLEEGDSRTPGDYDISVKTLEPETFYYDPRSFKYDFSDARFMGVAKWVDLDDAKSMFPEKEGKLSTLTSGMGAEFTLDDDRSIKWTNSYLEQVFICEHWYRSGKKWLYAIYCGSLLLDSGQSYLRDEKGRDECRFIAYRSFVDQDGDSYSFHRNFKSLVDEINQRNSKMLWLASVRRVFAEKGAVDDVEKARREMARADGYIEKNTGRLFETDDARTLADIRALTEMREVARSELENFGPNPALVGQGVEQKSGRAIALLQQAGIAELGLWIIGNRNFKIRVYRAIWNAIRRYWTAERWIRVTDAEGQQQSVQINGSQIDPQTGMQQMVNSIGALDVDIKIDEGPDAVNMQADALEVLQTAASQGQQIPPAVMIELLPLPDSLKKKLLGMIEKASQPPPGAQEAMQLQLAGAQADVVDKQAAAKLKEAQTIKALADAGAAGQPQPMGESGPSPIEQMTQATEAHARAMDLHAAAGLKVAQTEKTYQDIQLAPQKMAQDAEAKRAQLQVRNRQSEQRSS